MDRSPILTPEGGHAWTMGGPNAWFTDTHRGFNASGEWLGGDRRNPARVLCIWRAGNILTVGRNHGAWVINVKVLHEFVGFDRDGKCTGSVSAHAIAEVREALPLLGFDANDKQAALALLDCLVKWAPRARMIPPAPRVVRERLEAAEGKTWEVTQIDKASGKVIAEAEV